MIWRSAEFKNFLLPLYFFSIFLFNLISPLPPICFHILVSLLPSLYNLIPIQKNSTLLILTLFWKILKFYVSHLDLYLGKKVTSYSFFRTEGGSIIWTPIFLFLFFSPTSLYSSTWVVCVIFFVSSSFLGSYFVLKSVLVCFCQRTWQVMNLVMMLWWILFMLNRVFSCCCSRQLEKRPGLKCLRLNLI